MVANFLVSAFYQRTLAFEKRAAVARNKLRGSGSNGAILRILNIDITFSVGFRSVDVRLVIAHYLLNWIVAAFSWQGFEESPDHTSNRVRGFIGVTGRLVCTGMNQ